MAAPGRSRREDEAVRITTAPTSHRDDLQKRRRRYAVSMSIRTLCFIGAVVVGEGWLRWVLVAAAFLLPYVAVVMANSASPRIEGSDLLVPELDRPQLTQRPKAPPT